MGQKIYFNYVKETGKKSIVSVTKRNVVGGALHRTAQSK